MSINFRRRDQLDNHVNKCRKGGKPCRKAAQIYMKKGGGRKPPCMVTEIVYGISLGIFVGNLWKMHHWNNQRRTKQFYKMLQKGLITTVVDEPSED